MATKTSKSGKCVLLARVSTTKQDYTEQLNAIADLAEADGYSRDSQVVIAEKESGIKVSEEDRSGLLKLYSLLSDGEDVRAVYCNTIDRISRRRKVLYDFIERMKAARVQVVVNEPRIRMFKEDGSEDEMADMVFGIFASLAESEMRNKKVRMKYGFDRRSKEGKVFSERNVPWGYDIVDGRAVVNTMKADIVRKVFTDYAYRGKSYSALARELNALGHEDVTMMTIRGMLSNPRYTGRTIVTDKLKYETTFPAIVTEELFEAANRATDEHVHNAPKNRYIYYGSGLVHEAKKGTLLTARRGWGTTYASNVNKCGVSFNISVNAVDSALWHCVRHQYIDKVVRESRHDRAEVEKQVEALRQRLSTLERKMGRYDAKRERIAESYVEGTISREKRDGMLRKVADEAKSDDDERKRLTGLLNWNLERLDAEGADIGKLENIKDRLENLDDDREICDIVHLMVDRVMVDGDRDEKTISIYLKSSPDTPVEYTYYPMMKKHTLFKKAPITYEVPLLLRYRSSYVRVKDRAAMGGKQP